MYAAINQVPQGTYQRLGIKYSMPTNVSHREMLGVAGRLRAIYCGFIASLEELLGKIRSLQCSKS